MEVKSPESEEVGRQVKGGTSNNMDESHRHNVEWEKPVNTL